MKRSLAVILLLLLCACGLLPEVKDETSGWSADKLYTEAKDEISKGSYTTAIKYLEKLEARYPYGRYAQQAQIDLAYVYFKDNDHATHFSVDRGCVGRLGIPGCATGLWARRGNDWK